MPLNTPLSATSPKSYCSMAFKEWDIICQTFGQGEQHLVFRKGGIHEGRDGFSFKHEAFALFPTRFHAQGEFVTHPCPPAQPEWQIDEEVSISYFAKASWATTLTNWNDVLTLKPYHIYQESLLKERFTWGEKDLSTGSIHLAFVRIFKFPQPLLFPYKKQYGGCRSWIKIPEYSLNNLEPVLSNEEFSVINNELKEILPSLFTE